MINKKIFFIMAPICISASVLLSGCGKEYAVEFKDGGSVSMQTARAKSKLEEPEILPRDGYNFIGWFKDSEYTEKWDFGSDKVTSDMSLYAAWDKVSGGEISYPDSDKDFSKTRTPGSQEAAYEYKSFFLPSPDKNSQPYVGDTMPYYENGVYYIYYLKDGGDSYNHSVYLATTTDFINYAEHDEPVLEASRDSSQDSWIGTGSMAKIADKYYFFYTGHSGSADAEYKEKIMLAESDDLTSFEKVKGWEIVPPDELGQKNDFRDPQAYYDPETDTISLTVTASQGNVARILKYTLSSDLQDISYDGIIFTDPTGDFWNLECSDTFMIGGKWYITYSAQDDTLWYAMSGDRFGPYSEPERLDGKLFYAAKHVEDENNSYMVGWARRSESASSTQDVAAWAGNLAVQKIVQKEDGSLFLAPDDSIKDSFSVRRELPTEYPIAAIEAGSAYSYRDAFTCYESFMLTGDFTFTGSGSLGLAFDYSGKADKYKFIEIDPADDMLRLSFNEGKTPIAETKIDLEQNKEYSFTYIQEGSVGIFYIDDTAALTVRIYGASGKTIKLFAENNSVKFSSLREYTR